MSQANHSLKILVVDDNRDSAFALFELLKAMGHVVTKCFDGITASEVFFEFQPQVILLDIGMPLITGHDVCRAIRNTPEGSRTMIIAQTGWGQELDRIKSRQAGFDYHLVKPIDTTMLMAILEETSGRIVAG